MQLEVELADASNGVIKLKPDDGHATSPRNAVLLDVDVVVEVDVDVVVEVDVDVVVDVVHPLLKLSKSTLAFRNHRSTSMKYSELSLLAHLLGFVSAWVPILHICVDGW